MMAPAPERHLRALIALSAAVSALCIVFILDYSGYPFEPYRYWILEFLLRTQDISGSALLLAIVLGAWVAPSRMQQAALDLVDVVARHPWRVAALTFLALCLGTLHVAMNHPLAQDEYAALFQSKVFAAGRLTGEYPPELVGRLIPPYYMNQFFYGSFQSGQVASAYWPGFALLLTPFTFLGIPWACNPLLASLALVLIGRLAEQLTGEPRARGWAMIFALASPGFMAMAITYFSMTAHLLLNLVYVALVLQRDRRALVLAGLVGSLALVLHNPLPHSLFALPWIVWLWRQAGGYRNILALTIGYLPLALLLGFGWAHLLSDIQGNTLHGLLPHDGQPLNRIANFFWTWHIKMRTALDIPDGAILAARLAELVRLWTWAMPGLLLLAVAGWWLGRRDPRILLLGLSVICTLFGYFVISFNQGHGWGARYVHPAWGSLPILAAAALSMWRDAHGRLAGYVAALAVLSLVFANGLRATQIHDYMRAHLDNRPPADGRARNVVFVTMDVPNYTLDLVQNDPFLREPTLYLLSLGRVRDEELVRARFPGGRLVVSDRRGQVWRLDR